ncbi:DUF742 domain-containing protein [Streptomyces actuosus]|uniref:DUF742 domain-containing protein n=1 Tax=Streptomyces actuosus TaxID=1885 RepID=A0ABS2VK68_STRAS|nr:DUF742 domain-containing protein [Streptomyces actuosus]
MTVPPHGDPPGTGSLRYDRRAGPLVRPYALTGGRTRSGRENARFDLIALVARDPAALRPDHPAIGPEHRTLTGLCRTGTRTVAELAADTDLPLGVVRVLLGDLLELGRVAVNAPVQPARLPDERILRDVIDGLRGPADERDPSGRGRTGTARNRSGATAEQSRSARIGRIPVRAFETGTRLPS